MDNGKFLSLARKVRAERVMMIYKVEIRGRGIMPYEFATKSEAEAYAITATAWIGGAYRIHRVKAGA